MMLSNSTKRPREDEPLSLPYHETKKFRLSTYLSPLNTTFSSSVENSQFIPRSIPVSLTPVDSSDDEDMNMFSSTRPENRERQHSQRRPPMLCLDTSSLMQLDDEGSCHRVLANGDNLSPWPMSPRSKVAGSSQPSPIPHQLLNQSLNISGGRTATPIYGHFRYSTCTNTNRDELTTKSPGMNSEEEISWWQKRSLPSPISEDEDMMSNCFDNINNTEAAFRPLTTPVEKYQPSSQHDAHIGSKSTLITKDSLTVNHGENSTSTSTQRKGRVGLAMGYRADCEKCHLKIPGHYSHIVCY